MTGGKMLTGNIEVRHCQGLGEFEACLDLEKRVWGSNDLDVVPSAMFVVVHETGGQVLGAFDRDAGGQMVGFTLAMAAFRGPLRYLHSHMTAVLEPYRDRGIGRLLKQFQRSDALERGVELVEWTFDPLELRNAYFNIERLGVIVRRYLPNIYGITTSPLHGGMPTDRLVAEWWLASARARQCAGEAGGAMPAAASRANAVRISIPRDIGELRRSDREAAVRVQAEMREQFQKNFAENLAVTGIEFDARHAHYILEPYAD